MIVRASSEHCGPVAILPAYAHPDTTLERVAWVHACILLCELEDLRDAALRSGEEWI